MPDESATAVPARSQELPRLPEGLPAGWLVRRPGGEDAGRLHALCVASDVAVMGYSDLSRDDVAADIAAPTADPERNQVVVLDGPGEDARALAWAWVQDRAERRVVLDTYVDLDLPADQRELLGAWAWRWSVERGRQVGAERGVDLTLLDVGLLEGDDVGAAWLSGNGFERVRTFWRFSRDVAPDESVPEPAPGVAIRPLRTGDGRDEDLRTAYEINEAAFADHWNHHPDTYDEWWGRRVSGAGHDLSLWWLAEVDGRPVGLLSATTAMVEEGTLWVGIVATLREARRRGVAKALLHTAFAEAQRRGWSTVGLTVDGDSLTGANLTYAAVGMAPQYAIQAWHREVPTAIPR